MTSFLVIFAGQAISLFGSELVQFALIWWLTQTSGSATTLAAASLVGLLPPVFLGPFAGALVDRWNRRAVMMLADGVIALATLVLAALFALGIVQVWHVYVLMFVRALGGAFHWPAMQASTTLMVPEEHLSRVAGMNQALRGIVSVAMPPLGALLLTLTPLPTILAIDVGTALLAIVPLFFIHIPQPARTLPKDDESSTVWTDLREGIRFVWGWRGMAILIGLISLLHFWAAPAFSLVPIVVTKYFGRGALELAWMQSASGIGLLAGGLLLGVWGGFKRRIVTVLLGISLMGVCVAVMGILPNTAFWMAVGAMFCTGVLAPMVVGSFQAVQQVIVPPEIQGRVFALARSGMDVMSPLGMVVAGPVADMLGVQRWYLLTGVVLVVMAVGAFFIPALIRLEERET
ncbi:MAG: MFS transporter [Chloroflexi bacterium]|nr:MFS transporter [Chloroflexota bacterium]